jgi:hypothetical protein
MNESDHPTATIATEPQQPTTVNQKEETPSEDTTTVNEIESETILS